MKNGIIVATDKTAEELYIEWDPETLGSRSYVYDEIASVLGVGTVLDDENTYDKDDAFIYLKLGDEHPPITISVTYGSRGQELQILKEICFHLRAKLFDSELFEFVDL